MSVRILRGDTLAHLRSLPDASVNCVVTSPPYYGLRSYLPANHPDKALEIGLEQSPAGYVGRLVEVFREVRRVLRDDGVVWLNIGDSYANDGKWGGETGGKLAYLDDENRKRVGREKRVTGLKPKDLIGIPWRVAFAMQDDGWWLRADNVWGKPNGMPESTTDRTTRAHEYVFHLTKSATYWYDQEAVRTAPKASSQTQLATPYTGQSTKDHGAAGVQDASDIKRRIVEKGRRAPSPKYVEADGMNNADIKARYYDKQRGHSRCHAGFNDLWDAMEREEQVAQGGNLRSVWWISPAQYPDAHFAVMPNELAEICIRAGCPAGGTVLDPFGGAGTTGLIADRLGRNAILIELFSDFADMARRRISDDAGMFGDVA